MHRSGTDDRIQTGMEKTFKELLVIEPETPICDKIYRSVVSRVERFEIMRSKRRSIAYKLLSLATMAALVPSVNYIVKSIYLSGFGEYVSLIVSDSSYMTAHWKEFLLSTASSLPITGTIVVLLTLFILASSLRRTVKYSMYTQNIRQGLITI